jgi:hypothetical protein
MSPIALTIAEACATARIGRTRLYDSLRSGDLVGRKHGKRTLILSEDLYRWLQALPKVEPKP